jgi:hypothetical protein
LIVQYYSIAHRSIVRCHFSGALIFWFFFIKKKEQQNFACGRNRLMSAQKTFSPQKDISIQYEKFIRSLASDPY